MKIQFFLFGAALLGAVAGAPAALASDPVDETLTNCFGPAGDPAEGTPEFNARDLQNMFCSEQRRVDYFQHPSNLQFGLREYGGDPYRLPERLQDKRFRYQMLDIPGARSEYHPGADTNAEIYIPCAADSGCALPEGLQTFEPPYPVAVVMHGFASDKNHLWWASQPLAENGYLVIAVNSDDNTLPNDVLAWIFATDDPENDERRALMDRDRIGMAGHSLGAENSTRTQGDSRVSAIIGWDNCASVEACENSPGSRLHDKGAEAQTPTLFITADYKNFPGYPTPTRSVPGTLRLSGYEILRDNGVDTMLITTRASTHLDWAGTFTFGSRYNEAASAYFNLAWFDRYLKGRLVEKNGTVVTTHGRDEMAERAFRQAEAADAYARLTATRFDDSADRHNISQGYWDAAQAALSGDPMFGGNVPYTIAGTPVEDRLSFYHPSVCRISRPDYTPDDGEDVSDVSDTGPKGNMRASGEALGSCNTPQGGPKE